MVNGAAVEQNEVEHFGSLHDVLLPLRLLVTNQSRWSRDTWGSRSVRLLGLLRKCT